MRVFGKHAGGSLLVTSGGRFTATHVGGLG